MNEKEKPKPLKGKTMASGNGKVLHEVYDANDIRSAVEWLEKADEKVFLEYDFKENAAFLAMIGKLAKNRCEAFEDVIKDEKGDKTMNEKEKQLELEKEREAYYDAREAYVKAGEALIKAREVFFEAWGTYLKRMKEFDEV